MTSKDEYMNFVNRGIGSSSYQPYFMKGFGTMSLQEYSNLVYSSKFAPVCLRSGSKRGLNTYFKLTSMELRDQISKGKFSGVKSNSW